jgi:hypothetical protein
VAVAALVVFGFGLIAVATAAVASGFIATEVIENMLGAEGATRDVYRTLLEYTGIVNQAFAKVNVVSCSTGILLFSLAMLKASPSPRFLANTGFVVGGSILVAFLAGHLRLNVHGYGIVIAFQAVWLIWTGIVLCRARA